MPFIFTVSMIQSLPFPGPWPFLVLALELPLTCYCLYFYPRSSPCPVFFLLPAFSLALVPCNDLAFELDLESDLDKCHGLELELIPDLVD